jgi:hypothetical protein
MKMLELKEEALFKEKLLDKLDAAFNQWCEEGVSAEAAKIRAKEMVQASFVDADDQEVMIRRACEFVDLVYGE